MRYALAFGLIALANAIFACRAESPAGVLLWGDVAVSFFGLSGFYVFRPSLKWFKKPSGQMGWPGFFLFWPYFLLAWVVLFLRSRIETRSPFTEIAPGLFLGRRPFGFDRGTLDSLNIEIVLDLTWEFGASRRVLDGRSYRSFPALDGTALTLEQFAEAVKWLNERNGRAVLVHCALGNSRSASIVCAFLVARGLVPEEAIRLVRAKRPSVGLNREQVTALSGYFAQMPIY